MAASDLEDITSDEEFSQEEGSTNFGSIDDYLDTDDEEGASYDEVIVHNEPPNCPCLSVHLIMPLPNIPGIRYVCGICDNDYPTLEETLHHVLACIHRDVQRYGMPSTRVDFYVSFWSWYPGQGQPQ